MFLEKDSNVHVFEPKEVIEVIKEIVLEMDDEIENELKGAIKLEAEEVLLLSTAYELANYLLSKMELHMYRKEDIRINGGWWYNVGMINAFGDSDSFYTVLKITDGVVDNYFIFVPTIV